MHHERRSLPFRRLVLAALLAAASCLHAVALDKVGGHPLKVWRSKLRGGKPGPHVIQNSLFRLEVGADAGGTVKLIATHDRHTFLKTYWYPHHVAYGKLFSDQVTAGAETKDSARIAYQVVSTDETKRRIALKLVSPDGALAPGLRVEKTYVVTEGVSGFVLEQRFVNAGAKGIRARFGLRYSADPERWSRHYYQRVFCGDGGRMKSVVSSCRDTSASRTDMTIQKGRAWFISANSYGRAVVAQFDASAAPLHVEIAGVPLPKKRVVSGVATVRTGEVTLQPGKSISLRCSVLVGQSMPELGGVTRDGLVFGADVPRFRPSGHLVSMYATGVSQSGRRLAAVFRERLGSSNTWTDIGRKSMTLSPGEVCAVRVTHRFNEPGARVVSVTFLENGKTVASVLRSILVGDPKRPTKESAALAKTWLLRMPEHRVRGSWKEIGRQIARLRITGLRNKKLRAAAKEWQSATPDLKKRVAEVEAFYRKHLPEYVALLQGEAEGMKVSLVQILLARLPKRTAPSW